MAEAYDTSDEALFRLVDVDELDALLAAGARPVTRDGAKVMHLLTRMRATLEANRVTVLGLHKHIGQVQDHLSRVGAATTLNPMDALRYLDDEQRELLFDRIARDRLAQLRHLVDRAGNERERVVGELEAVREVVGSVAQRADLPPDVRAEFTRLLAHLPEQVSPVSRPAMLDFPDGEPAEADPAPPRPRTGTPPPAPHPSVAYDAAPAAFGDLSKPAQGAQSPVAQEVHPEPAVTAPAYVDPFTQAAPPPAYVDPYAAPDPAPAYVDPYAEPAGTPLYRDPFAPDPPATANPPAGTDLADLFD